MSIVFAAIVVLLCIVAAVFALWPILRSPGRGRLILAAAVLLFVAGVGAGTYLSLGRPGAGGPHAGRDDTRDTGGLIALLVKRVHQAPNDLRAWEYLGRAYLTLGDDNDAARAFLRALQIDRNNGVLYSAYGEALVGASHGAVPPEAEAALRKGADACAEGSGHAVLPRLRVRSAGRKRKAIALWQSLVDEAPPNAPYRQELVDRIAALSRAK
ncbi:MAG: tetratricopeptide repeat protein [Rhizomicrobium sp.]